MKVTNYEDRDAWLAGRETRITGSKAHSVVGAKGEKKKTFWDLLAERVVTGDENEVEGENVMDRGHRLEPEALALYEEQIGRKINNELRIFHRDDNERIAVSPDGTVDDTEWCEVKCLNDGHHLEAYHTNDFPKTSTLYYEYRAQALQNFIVNEKLLVHHVIFYNPRMPAHLRLHSFTIKREDVQADVQAKLLVQQSVLMELDRLEQALSPF